MATYRLTSPSGHVYEVTGPDDATPEQIVAFGEEQMRAQEPDTKAPPTQLGPDIQEPGLAQQFGQSAQNTVAGLAQGVASVPDAAISATAGVMGLAANNALRPAFVGAARAMGYDPAEADAWFDQNIVQPLASPRTIGSTIEEVSPTPEGGGGVRLASQLAGGMANIPGLTALPAGMIAKAPARALQMGSDGLAELAGHMGIAPHAVREAAERQGVAILPQDVAGPGIGRATAGAAQTTFGTSTVGRAADRLYDSFKGRVAEIGGEPHPPVDVGNTIAGRAQSAADRAGTAATRTGQAVQDFIGGTVDETGVGQIAQRGVSRWMDETAQKASDLYARVPIAPEQPAQLEATRSLLSEITATWRSNPELGAAFRSGRLSRYLGALTPEEVVRPGRVLPGAGRAQPEIATEGGQLSWSDLSEFRTRVGDMLANPALTEKIAPRQLRALYGSLTKDMEATAQAQGPEALSAWKRANNYYDGRMKRINDTLSMVTGERKDKTANEALAAIEGTLRKGSTGNGATFSRLMRSLPKEDAGTIRASLVARARGDGPKAFSQNWAKLSERGKSALLPDRGMRDLMDDAAGRAGDAQINPFAGKSGEQVFHDFERMAESRGDSIRFNVTLNSLSPEEANAARATLIHRMGLSNAGAQNANGDAFSIAQFLTRWNRMTPEAKGTLFGNADMRANMDDLAMLADRVKASAKLAGHSNTGAVNNFNATTGGLGGAVLALITGHPIVATGLAAPAAYQRLSAEVLTSPRLVRWLAKTPNKPNPGAVKAHIAALGAIAKSEPAIANDVLHLQARLQEAFSTSPAGRVAAQENDQVGREPPEKQQQ